ncbi:MAG: hypothetical protein AAF721_18880 [Myxococcota bacterium]
MVARADEERPETGTTRPAIVLACASADAPAIARQLRRLVDLGVRAEIVAGVDLDVRPLEARLERRLDRSAYVICCSEELDAYQTDLLDLTIRAAEVPAELVWTVPFQASQLEAFVSDILERLHVAGWLAQARPHAQARRRSMTLRGIAIPAETPAPARRPRSTARTRRYSDDLLEGPKPTAEPAVAAPQPRPARRPRRRWVAALGVAAAAALTWLSLPAAEEAHAEDSGVRISVATAAGVAQDANPTRERSVPGTLASTMAAERESAGAQTVHAALAQREIRGLDALLVAPSSTRRVRRKDAAAQCNALERAGRSDWRLPSAPELAALGSAGFVAPRVAWWTRGSKRKALATWNGKKVRRRAAKRRTTAKTICVAPV